MTRKRRHVRAIKWRAKAIRRGCGESMALLAEHYWHSAGVARSHRQALLWYRCAANFLDPSGLFEIAEEQQKAIANEHQKAKDAPDPCRRSAELMTLAAAMGYPRAQCWLASNFDRYHLCDYPAKSLTGLWTVRLVRCAVLRKPTLRGHPLLLDATLVLTANQLLMMDLRRTCSRFCRISVLNAGCSIPLKMTNKLGD
jgi:TPR repeat protein